MDVLIQYFKDNMRLVYTTLLIMIVCAAAIVLIVFLRKRRYQKSQHRKEVYTAADSLLSLPHSETQDSLFLDPVLNEETKNGHLQKNEEVVTINAEEPLTESSSETAEPVLEKTEVAAAAKEAAATKEAAASKVTENQPVFPTDTSDKSAYKPENGKNETSNESLKEEKTDSAPDTRPAKEQQKKERNKYYPQRSANAKPQQENQPIKYAGKWLIYKEDGKYAANLVASNGEVLLRSETYTALSGVKSGIETIKNNVAKNNFAISLDKNGNFFFKLYSSSTRLLCVSEGYSAKSVCESAIESVKRFSETAVLEVKKEEADK